MTNTNIGLAQKGSRRCLQDYMVKDRTTLNNLILSSSASLLSFVKSPQDIKWKSPIPKDNFYEYRDDFLSCLDLGIDLNVSESKLRTFWPKGGPQWDGLATVEGHQGTKGVLLIEAKAHTDETKSELKAISKNSIDMITDSFEEVQKYMGLSHTDWSKPYYQLANRIAYLYFMNIILEMPTWLVLINFIDDTYKPTNLDEWLNHYNKVFDLMGIKYDSRLMDKIILAFPPAV